MKKHSRGFVLTETLIVSAVVAFTLVILYSQFRKINTNYNIAFKYNNSNDLFLLYNIKEYLNEEPKIKSFNEPYADITNCYDFTENNYCTKLLEVSNVKTLIYSEITCNELKNELDETNYSNGLKMYINNIDSAYTNGYRLIAEFNDGTYANIIIGGA